MTDVEAENSFDYRALRNAFGSGIKSTCVHSTLGSPSGRVVKYIPMDSVMCANWKDAEEDWVERTAVLRGIKGQGLGKQVILSRYGNVLAVTTSFSKQAVIYQHQTSNTTETDAASGHWEPKGSAISDVYSIHMTSDGKRIAAARSVPRTVQVYDWSNAVEDWVAVGDAVEGTAARLADDGTLVVQTRNANGPFLRILQVE